MKRIALLSMLIGSVIYAGVQAQSPAPSPAQPAPAHAGMMGGDMPAQMRMMNDMMVKQLGRTDPDYEKRFIDMMIPHDEGALLAAKHALMNANRPELKEMAQKIIEAQQKEIGQLKQWRQEWYAAPK